ncbi:MAG: trypsin-like peptidase domain-containing protein [Caldiserica bacterium]|nr:trypsin-like peptidase domain-containing protein [Caldisericota bacterium]
MRHVQRYVAIVIVAAIMLALPFAPSNAWGQAGGTQTIIALQVGKPSMTVNGVSKPIDVQGTVPVIVEGRTFLPIRAVVEALGGSIAWTAAEQKVTIIMGSDVLELFIGKSTARVNGTPMSVDPANPKVVPFIIGGRTMLPVRFVAERLGGTVAWNDATKTATLTFGSGATQTLLSVTEIAKKVESVVYIEVAFADGKGASGSGFIISPDGRIVTNYHVIDGAASGKVVLNDGTTFIDIKVLGWNKEGDLAIIKISGSGLPAVTMGNSDAAQIGEAVVAIGSPLGLQNTVSTGIISARREGFLQTTAPISHGSSGGALFNMTGEVIGITSAGMEEGPNLGFAIPINEVKSLATDRTLTLAQFTAQMSGSVTSSVSVPSLIQPAATTEVDNLTPTFQWTKVATATRYTFWLGKGTTGTEDTKIYSEVVTTDTLTLPAGILTDGGTYTWAVAAGNETGWGDWSQDSVFSVRAVGTLGVPETLEPDQEVTVPMLTPTFFWRAVTGATRYTFWLGKSWSGLQDTEVLSRVVTGMSFTLPAQVLLDGEKYTWNVSAGDASDWGDWGEDQHFTVEVPSGLRVPALLTPLPYATGLSRTATFTWTQVSGAMRYTFWLGKGTSGSQDSEILNVVVAGTSYTILAGTLDAGAVYTWNVSAGTATVWGGWTMDRYFKTAP